MYSQTIYHLADHHLTTSFQPLTSPHAAYHTLSLSLFYTLNPASLAYPLTPF